MRRAVDESILWYGRRDGELREGVVIERSLDGLVFLVPVELAPRPGRRLKPIIRRPGGSTLEVRSLLVRRLEPFDDQWHRVAAEFEE